MTGRLLEEGPCLCHLLDEGGSGDAKHRSAAAPEAWLGPLEAQPAILLPRDAKAHVGAAGRSLGQAAHWEDLREVLQRAKSRKVFTP